MKKMNVLLKGSMVVAFGISSLFLSNNLDFLTSNISYAESQEADQEVEAVKDSLSAKKSIFEDKLEFANEFMKTRAYKEASQVNRNRFYGEVSEINNILIKVTEVLSNENNLGNLRAVEDEISPSMNKLLDALNDIYKDDSLISKLIEANIAISVNKIENVPSYYKSEYTKATNAISKEYENIWLENKVYNEKEITDIIVRYQSVVNKINKYNRQSDIVIKIKNAIKQNQEKIEIINNLKKFMPNSAKRYEKTINAALEKATKAVNDGLEWLKKHNY